MSRKTGLARVVPVTEVLMSNLFSQAEAAKGGYPLKPVNVLIGIAPRGGSDGILSMVRSLLEK